MRHKNLPGLGKSFFRNGLIAALLHPFDRVSQTDPIPEHGRLDELAMHAQPGNDVVFADLLFDRPGESGYFNGHLFWGPRLYRFHHLSG